MTTCLSRYSAELMANHVIESLNGGELVVYAAGTSYPRHPNHTLARSVIEVCRYRLAAPCGVFDDSIGYSRILFTPPVRISQQPDVESYPNFFRIYNAEGVSMYQGAARAIDYRFDDGNSIGRDNTISDALILYPLDKERDARYGDGVISNYGWTKLPRWVDVNITSFAIKFGGAD